LTKKQQFIIYTVPYTWFTQLDIGNPADVASKNVNLQGFFVCHFSALVKIDADRFS